VSVVTRSEAKILGFRRLAYLKGKRYSINIAFKNLENSDYPGGGQVCVLAIYPTQQQTNFAPRTIPQLRPGEEKPSDGWYQPAQTLAEGTVLFRAVLVGPATLPSVDLVAPDGTVQGPQSWTAITWLNVELMRDFYTFYALVAAAVSMFAQLFRDITSPVIIGVVALLVLLMAILLEPE